MARMYPNQLVAVRSLAEERLYEAFRDELDNSYTVFHGVHWQALDGEGRPRDGEADFVIVHPEQGILILEAKGGAISHDPFTGLWTSTDRAGKVHDIKDPFYQARTSKYGLQDALAKTLGRAPAHIQIGHAVAFPDVSVEQELLRPDQPREIIMDIGDLGQVSSWVGRTMAFWRGPDRQQKRVPGEEAVAALLDMLGKSWELRPVMWGEIRLEQEQFIRLTNQQYLILDLLNQQRRALISGCAGSGKTTLAIEKARRLARQGFRVLFTCFNKSLAADLRRKLPKAAQLEICHFHELCHDLAQQAGVLPEIPPITNYEGRQHFFDQQLPEALLKATDRLTDVRYDVIIVDEGQDFQENWWTPLQLLLDDPDGGILYIFFDDNQRLYDRLNEFPIQTPPYPLNINCRNTRSIHRQVLKFYRGPGSRPTAWGPKGRPVELVRFSDASAMVSRLAQLLERLTIEEDIPAEEIVVLTPLRKKSRLWSDSPPGLLSLSSDWPPGQDQVFATTIHDFKGLESSVIVLVETERWPAKAIDLERLLYVACSRARHHLIVFLPVPLSTTQQRYFS